MNIMSASRNKIITLSTEYIETLKKLAKRKTWQDTIYDDEDTVIDDFAGGNVDDAFDGGYRSGETDLARQVLDNLGISY
jgi:hypothetical protein